MSTPATVGPELSPFQDRDDILAAISADGVPLINLYGEAGSGKSRVLSEKRRRLQEESPPCLVLFVALQHILQAIVSRPEAVLRALVESAGVWLKVDWQDADMTAIQIVSQLNLLADRMGVYLMFDTTEVLQEDMIFWRWMETSLVGPLIVEGKVRQVFAGRVPVPWRRIEVRRALRLYALTPLPLPDAARELARAVLQQHGLRQSKNTSERAIDLILEFSFGHPALTEEVARWVVQLPQDREEASLRYRLCNEVVKPFVEGFLFEGIEYPWKDILWWASVLVNFDATILRRYLTCVDPALIEGQPDYFFIQGIARLRIHNTVLWREADGDQLHGVIGEITRHCLEVMQPERYRRANLMAARTLEDLIPEFPEDDPEALRYRREADLYQRRATGEAS